MHDCLEVPRQVRVTRVQTNPHISWIHRTDDIEKVACVAKKEMGKHVFKKEHDAHLLALAGDLVQSLDGVVHSSDAFFRGGGTLLFGIWVNSEMLQFENLGRFGGA